MSGSSATPPPRNRRFLVSIWQTGDFAERAARDRTIAPEDEELRGLVWEADPRDPGRIVQPESFSRLNALPWILGAFLSASRDEPDGEEGD